MDDDELLRRAQQGDRNAKEAIYRRYSARLFWWFRGQGFQLQDAEDAVQRTFTKFLIHLSQRHPIRNLWSYLLNTARGIATAMREQRSNQSLQADGPAAPSDRISSLSDCLERLPPRLREALIYDFHHTKPEVTDVGDRQWLTRVKQAKEFMQRCLKEKGEG